MKAQAGPLGATSVQVCAKQALMLMKEFQEFPLSLLCASKAMVERRGRAARGRGDPTSLSVKLQIAQIVLIGFSF